jgi:hypothetical protein
MACGSAFASMARGGCGSYAPVAEMILITDGAATMGEEPCEETRGGHASGNADSGRRRLLYARFPMLATAVRFCIM